MTASFDFYFSYRSPYSYLAIPQVEKLEAELGVRSILRVVRPLAIRVPGFFERADRLRTPYMRRDAIRCAEVAGIPYRWPRPDPVNIDDATGVVGSDQPRIHRLCRLGAAACELGKGFAFAREVSATLWSGAVDNWHEGTHLEAATERAELDWTELTRRVDDDPDGLDAILDANETAQREAGHWGVPLFVLDGEPFFGQDRIDHLAFRLKQRQSGGVIDRP